MILSFYIIFFGAIYWTCVWIKNKILKKREKNRQKANNDYSAIYHGILEDPYAEEYKNCPKELAMSICRYALMEMGIDNITNDDCMYIMDRLVDIRMANKGKINESRYNSIGYPGNSINGTTSRQEYINKCFVKWLYDKIVGFGNNEVIMARRMYAGDKYRYIWMHTVDEYLSENVEVLYDNK